MWEIPSCLNPDPSVTPRPEDGGGNHRAARAGSCRGSVVLLLLFCAGISGCGSDVPSPTKKTEAPAKVLGGKQESDLATITLTSEAEQRLGIQTMPINYENVRETRTYAGEVVIPPGRSITVTAPLAGVLRTTDSGDLPAAGQVVTRGREMFRLHPLEQDLRGRNLLAAAEQDLAASEARVQAAQLNLKRAEQLLRDKAGSVRSLEQAEEEVALAEAARRGAQAQVDYLESAPLEAGAGLAIESPRDGVLVRIHASPGQTVAPGSPLFEVTSFDPIWVRVPVYVGELPSIETGRAALIHDLGASPGVSGITASPVTAPPTADPSAATADLYYQLANRGRDLRPGQKLGVTLTVRGEQNRLVIPWSAIIYDAHGTAWVYENPAPQTYVRRRVELIRLDGESAVLAHGPEPGTEVVITGAAELFGTEFGTGK